MATTKTMNNTAEEEFLRELESLVGRSQARSLLERGSKPRTEPEKTKRQKQYWDDPVAWVYDHIEWRPGEGLAPYQEEVLASITEKSRVAVRAGHGSGKTALTAQAILWFADTREGFDWKAITTASAWRQLTRYLWPEIHKWARRIKWERVGRPPYNARTELSQTALRLKTGQAFAVASDNFELIEGAHADYLLYALDEAKAIPDKTWDAVEGAFSGAGSESTREAFALAISTPGVPVGRFHDICALKRGYSDWTPRHITVDESISAGRVMQEWVDQRREQWGETSILFLNRVLAEFGTSEQEGVIPYNWAMLAKSRYPTTKEIIPSFAENWFSDSFNEV